MPKSSSLGLDSIFLKKRKLFIQDDIAEEIGIETVKKLQYLSDKSKEPIKILINSGGGYLNDTFMILDEIDDCKNKGIIINTIVLGAACSAAATILSAGTKGYRWARCNSIIMLHPCSFELDDEDVNKHEKNIEFINKRIENFHKILAKNCGIEGNKKYKKFLSDIANNKYMSSKEALKYGIIDVIKDNID